MNNNLKLNSALKFFALACSLSLSSTQFVLAGNLYVYKDAQGSALLTNKKVNSGSYKQEKVTYYPETNVHKYQNWGNSEAAVLPSYNGSKNAYDHIIRSAAQTYGVSEGLVKAIMHTESGFNVYAKSPVGAQGLMQLMPATARRFNVSNAYDPHQNIHGGVKYLSWLLKRFNGNTQLALAGYNAGEGNVDKYGGIPPFRETQDYVKRVMSRYNNLYANGSALASSVNNNAKVLAISSNYTAPSNTSSQREIITLGDGKFTDKARGTFANENAYVSANIEISE